MRGLCRSKAMQIDVALAAVVPPRNFLGYIAGNCQRDFAVAFACRRRFKVGDPLSRTAQQSPPRSAAESPFNAPVVANVVNAAAMMNAKSNRRIENNSKNAFRDGAKALGKSVHLFSRLKGGITIETAARFVVAPQPLRSIRSCSA